MKISKNPAKYEVLIKQCLRLILDISAKVPCVMMTNHYQNFQTDTDARSIFSDSSEEEEEEEIVEEENGKNEKEKAFLSRAVNTDPHYLSIGHWHSAEWKTDRKPCREPRVQSAPVKIKAIQTYYYDYSKT